MVGPAGSTSNAVICSPGANFLVQQYDITDPSFAGIVPHPTSGTTALACSQVDGVTIMTWSRGVDNGDPNDAQIVNPGSTDVIWAVGKSNTFDSTSPAMGADSVMLIPFGNTVELAPGLVLNWNVNGQAIDFQAAYSGNAWCVCEPGAGEREGGREGGRE